MYYYFSMCMCVGCSINFTRIILTYFDDIVNLPSYFLFMYNTLDYVFVFI